MAEAIQRITTDLASRTSSRPATTRRIDQREELSRRGWSRVTRISAVWQRYRAAVLTDVHEPALRGGRRGGGRAADSGIFVPPTDLLVLPQDGRAVNIKKGQFVAPLDMMHPVERCVSTGNERIFLTERGAKLRLQPAGGRLPIPAGDERKSRTVVFDATHSVQQPSAAGRR